VRFDVTPKTASRDTGEIVAEFRKEQLLLPA